MKSFQKMLSTMLALCLLACMLPAGVITARAATVNNLFYTVTDGEVTITGYTDFVIGALEIPSEIGGYPVTSIGWYAFDGCTGLTSITIPDSVAYIDGGAFYGCTGLTSITIPGSVASIGGDAFYGCTGLTSITIPDSVTSIGGGAFRGCTGLTSITISDSVTSIGNWAFSGCTGLTSITIPDSVTSIGYSAFNGCTGLTSITIPGSVTSIGEGAFSGCIVLESLTVDENNSTYHSDGNCIIDTDDKTLVFGCKTSVIPTDGSVTSIGDYAFSYCTGLTSITIPDSVTSISGSAFLDCTNLRDVYITDIAAWCNIDFYNDPEYGWEGHPFRYASNLYLNGKLVTDLVISDSVISIGDYAFYGYIGLSSIAIPHGVTSIGSHAFYGCTGLTSITIPDSVTSIGKWAFYNCTGLKNVHYGDDAAAWNNISIDSYNSALQNATIHYTELDSIAITTKPSKLEYFLNESFDATGMVVTAYYSNNTNAVITDYTVDVDLSILGEATVSVRYDECTATFKVLVKPLEISRNPVDSTCAQGETASFAVAVTGDGLKYQWQYFASAIDGWRNTGLSGYDTAEISFEAISEYNGYKFRCVVTDSYGNKVYSNAATLTVTVPKVTKNPTSVSKVAKDTATFKVTASGSGLKYQWQYRTSSTGAWKTAKYTGATTATMSVTATTARNKFQFRCVLTDKNGNKAYSSAATLTVTTPKVTKNPTSVSKVAKDTATFKVTASGSGLKYQWQYRTSSKGAWKTAKYTGATTATMTVTATTARNKFQFRCVVTDKNGNKAYSSVATLTVTTPKVTKNPTSVSKVAKDTATFKVTASGSGLKYQWQYRTSSKGAWKTAKYTGAKTATMSVTATTARNKFQFRCVVTDKNGNKAYSKAATLTVTVPKITKNPASATVKKGATAKFKVTASGSGLKYQWQYRTSSKGAWKTAKYTGAKTATMSVTATTARNKFQFRCIVTDKNGNKAYSKAATLKLK